LTIDPTEVAVPPSGFVNVRSYVPVMLGPLFAFTLTLRWLESTKLTLFTVKPPEMATVVPMTKFVPVIVKVTVVPLATTSWLVEVGKMIVGAALTVKALLPVPVPPSGLVTVTLRAPVVALLAMVMLTVRLVELTKVVELTVIPAPEKDAANPVPLTKPAPVTVMLPLKP
jgi:hypothetical protein